MALKKILCVAEKPSISKAVAGHLSGGQFQTVSDCDMEEYKTNVEQVNTQNTYIKNYKFTYDFGGQWGNCNVVFTCVSGHLTETQLGDGYNNWHDPGPKALFNAPVVVRVAEVSVFHCACPKVCTKFLRTSIPLQITSRMKQNMLMHSSFGQIVIEKESTSVGR